MNLIRALLVITASMIFSACAVTVSDRGDEDEQRSYVNMSAAGGSGSPFSGAVLSDDTLYISGMLGTVNGRIPDDPADEARAMLDRIQATLQRAGMTMDDLVYVTVYATDLSLYNVFNEVYRSYFSGPFPARAFIGAGSLLNGARFEMQSIASQE